MLLRRPRATLAVIAVALLVLLAAALVAPDRFRVTGFTHSGAPSAQALDTLRGSLGHDPEPGLIVSARAPYDFRSEQGRRALDGLVAKLAADPSVGKVDTAFGPDAVPYLLADDGHRTLVLVHFRSTDTDALKAPIARVRQLIDLPQAEIDVSGYAVGLLDGAEIARRDLIRADLIAIPVLFLLLVALFRGFAPAVVPLAIGSIAILATVCGLGLLANAVHVSVFALNLAVLLGLGLATDYGLLIVSRFREEAAAGGPTGTAVEATMATAGRTVALSGCAIAAAFSSLLLFPQPFIASMGLGGILVAVVATGSALTVSPPLLMLFGARIGSARRLGGGPRWERWTRWVVRRRLDVALGTAAVLVAAAGPVALLEPTFSDASSLPKGSEVRQGSDAVTRHFVPNLGYPVNVALPLQGRSPDIVLATVALAPGVAGVRRLDDPTGRYAIAQLLLAEGPTTELSQRTVRTLRELPGPTLVGGRTAELVDLRATIAERAPIAVAVAGLASALVLVLLTGSVLIALKAIVFNLLGLAAVFGVLVLLYGRIDLAAAVVIVVAVFALATDYAILLLARIVEAHEAGSDDATAIGHGMRTSGPVITSAALLISVPLLAQATSSIPLVRQLGVGQTLGILLDVTLIRLLLVPATIALLGRANWWAPRPLLRLRAGARRLGL